MSGYTERIRYNTDFELFNNYTKYLTKHYHSKSVLHRDITPDKLDPNYCIIKAPTSDDPVIDIPFRHPEILITGKVKSKLHDYYALFTSAIYIFTGKFLNTPYSPITDYCELKDKLATFRKTDLVNNFNDWYNEDRQKVIEYFYRLVIGDIIIST